MQTATLSIIIPAYNESRTIVKVLTRITDVKLPSNVQKEIIIVDDCSTDFTKEVIEDYILESNHSCIRYMRNEKNSGKGFSLRQGIKAATGDFVIIQDADLEYDPRDYTKLLEPAMEGVADVVYGSRLMSTSPRRILFFWHSIGNHFLTFLCNAFSNLNLTDMETGYKLFRREVIASINLRENRFGFEPEVTIKVARVPNIRIFEVGISYYGRTYAEGKKIGWVDGVRAIWCILKYSMFSRA
ncbi:MAG TPA: glycosyltransferase family 2 protein [Cyclobacteriaceae bacterium]|nr:glycosyltransferase family 2 protein [Cyclobacteriaceae bacterium]